MAKETAEQKLLKLIEQTQGDSGQSSESGSTPAGQQTQPAAQPAAGAQAVLASVQGVGIKSFALPEGLGDLIPRIKARFFGSEGAGFGLKEVNRLLLVVLILGIVYFCSHAIHGLRLASSALSFSPAKSVALKANNFLPEWQDVEVYQDALALRNVFNPFEKVEPKPEEVMTQEQLSTAKVNEKIKDLKLVGISWLDTPESASAMIENTTSGVTYFLYIGDDVNDAVVKEIYADSIVVEYNGERMEMRL